MFETEKIPVYIEGMSHKTIKIGKNEFKGTSLTPKIDPLTPELASELEAVKGICFRRNDAETNPHIKSVEFTLKPKAQTIDIHPDVMLRPSVTLIDAKVERFRVRRPADGNQLVLIFKVTVPEITANDLLYLKDALFEQRFFTFADMQGGLFAEAEEAAKRESKDAKPVRPSAGGESATIQ